VTGDDESAPRCCTCSGHGDAPFVIDGREYCPQCAAETLSDAYDDARVTIDRQVKAMADYDKTISELSTEITRLRVGRDLALGSGASALLAYSRKRVYKLEALLEEREASLARAKTDVAKANRFAEVEGTHAASQRRAREAMEIQLCSAQASEAETRKWYLDARDERDVLLRRVKALEAEVEGAAAPNESNAPDRDDDDYLPPEVRARLCDALGAPGGCSLSGIATHAELVRREVEHLSRKLKAFKKLRKAEKKACRPGARA